MNLLPRDAAPPHQRKWDVTVGGYRGRVNCRFPQAVPTPSAADRADNAYGKSCHPERSRGIPWCYLKVSRRDPSIPLSRDSG